MEKITALFMYAVWLWVVVPCVIGVAVYYLAIKGIVAVRWLLMDDQRRDVERRRKQIRVRD